MSYENSATDDPHYASSAQSGAGFFGCPPGDDGSASTASTNDASSHDAGLVISANAISGNDNLLEISAGSSAEADSLIDVDVSSDAVLGDGYLLPLAAGTEQSDSGGGILSFRLAPVSPTESATDVNLGADVNVSVGDGTVAVATAKADAGGHEGPSSLLHVNLASDGLVSGGDIEHAAQMAAADDLLAATVGDIGVPLLGEIASPDDCACSGPAGLSLLDVGNVLDTIDVPDCIAA